MRAIITQRVYYHKEYNEIWECLDSRLYEFLLSCGIVGFATSFKQRECIGKLFRDSDILVLSGGNDIASFKQRDDFELELIKYALANDKKIIGICRGMQIIAKYFNIDIIPSTHEIGVAHKLQGLEQVVHSYHSFCIKELPDGFLKLAYINDEIEAMRSKEVLAFMWHPEREGRVEQEAAMRIINSFLKDIVI